MKSKKSKLNRKKKLLSSGQRRRKNIGSTAKKKMRKKLDNIVRDIIRVRDNITCQRCDKEVTKHNAHTSHVRPESLGQQFRWDLLNLKLLCFSCHRFWWHLNPIEATKWFKDKFPARYDYVMSIPKSAKVYSLEELENIYAGFEQELKLLKGESE